MTDSGGNIKNAAEHMHTLQQLCLPHILNTCLKETMKVDGLRAALSSLRELTAFFHTSTVAFAALERVQEKENETDPSVGFFLYFFNSE